MRKLIGFVLTAMLTMAGGCSDHHPDVWFDAGSDTKASDAGTLVDAYQASAGDTAADGATVRDAAMADAVVAVDATADMPDAQQAVDAAADSMHALDTSTDDARKGDSP